MARRGAAEKLAKYRSMRDFTKTAEPSGTRAPSTRGSLYVIQQHAARRLHYDFRLELDGVLLSWSVPKGPSLSPSEKRLAVRTEDHPLDYGDFEGVIPKGEYGGGTVSVWDHGRWQPEGDPREAMRKGRLTFTLDGKKLHGKWHLIRTKPQGKQEGWLLFKSRDEAANENVDIVESRPESVISGRTLDEIAAESDRVWHSDRAHEPTVLEKRAARIAAVAKHQPANEENPRKNLYRNVQLANEAAKRARKTRGAEPSIRAQTAGDVAALVKQLPLGFELTNLDKVLYPEQGITKAQLIAYLAVVAEWALPQLADRPLTLVRCPEGRHKQCFFQKKIFPGSPKSIGTVKLREEDGTLVDYMKVTDMPGLVGLAQLGTLEIHTWGCHADKVERPDFMVFDIDPDPDLEWERVALAAFDTRRRLGELGFTSFVKTTGGKGLHVCAPIKRTIDWDSFKAFTKVFADKMAADEPKLYTSNMAKRARKGKVFVDYLRNGRNATFITPYSPRAREHAPVATPITWEELAHGVNPRSFTTKTVPARLAKLKQDPWAGIDDLDQAITASAWRALGAKPPKR
ncbi:MAG TPA: non-homologous end-joining DNA ligase [Kofleriaceae bacterium]|nr:non-homologous end-joining DNA ligase [Kofleriaceae bacterium]